MKNLLLIFTCGTTHYPYHTDCFVPLPISQLIFNLTLFTSVFWPVHVRSILLWLLRLCYLNLDIILPSYTFFHYVFTPYSHHHFITKTVHHIFFFSCLPYPIFFSSIPCTLLDIFLPLSLSPPPIFPLLCVSVIYINNLSFLILQSHYYILSLLFLNLFHSQPPYLTKG